MSNMSQAEKDRLDALITGRPVQRTPINPGRTTVETPAEKEEADSKGRVAVQQQRQREGYLNALAPAEREQFLEKERRSKMSDHDIHEQLEARQQFELDRRANTPLRAQVARVGGESHLRRAVVFFDAKALSLIPSPDGEFMMDAGQFMAMAPNPDHDPVNPKHAPAIVARPIPAGDLREGLRGTLEYNPDGTPHPPSARYGVSTSWLFIVDADQPDMDAPDNVEDADR